MTQVNSEKEEDLEYIFKEEISVYRSILSLESNKREIILQSRSRELESASKQISQLLGIAGQVEEKRQSAISKLFESREMAHVYHLQVRGDEGSFARHEALGKYYEEVLEIIDDVIEVYQGQYGIVENYDVIDTSGTKSKEPVDYFEELAEYVKHARKCITNEDTHTHSLLDDIVVLIYKTLYRLKFNK